MTLVVLGMTPGNLGGSSPRSGISGGEGIPGTACALMRV